MSVRPWWALAAIWLALTATACFDDDESESRPAFGSEELWLTAADGTTLSARIWPGSGERLIIYLHEYRSSQASWSSWAAAQRTPDISALTLDFRGHGDSEGLTTDIPGMLLDVEAAIGFGRDSGYEQVMLIGAGMGAAVAILAANANPLITAVGLSAPAEFGDLLPLATLAESPTTAERVWLMAAQEDISAANSLQEFRTEGHVRFTQSQLLAGRGHGIGMIEGPDATRARAMLDTVMREFWVALQ